MTDLFWFDKVGVEMKRVSAGVEMMKDQTSTGAWVASKQKENARSQVAHMIRSSTDRSLLLIDEFGKGTAPVDGIALVAALIRHLSRVGRTCLFTLHFHEVFR